MMNNGDVYLDFAAATPMDERVVNSMMPYFTDKFFNPSAPYLPSLNVKNDYNHAKDQIAKSIGAKRDQIIITAGATESINLAFKPAKNVIISGVEHPAVLKTAQAKTSVKIAPVNKFGLLDLNEFEKLIDDTTDFVSIALASSDLGTIQSISDVAQIVKRIRLERLKNNNKTPLIFHCDASQGFGYLDVNVARLGIDLLTLSAAKIYGPKQVALLWVKPGVKLQPEIVGGGQENGMRSGTENVAGVIGFARAVDIINKSAGKEIAKLRDLLRNEIVNAIPDVKFLGHPKKQLPNYLVASFGDIEAERLIYRLEERGVYISTGAACSANRGSGSLALKNIGLNESEQKSSLRMTLGKTLNKEQILNAAKIIIEEVLAEKNRVKK